MDINIKKSPTSSFRSFYLFFIVVTMQVGVGIMGAPRWIFIHARQDSWISILIAWLAIAIVVAIMLLILKQYENADIFGIQVDIFGKWIGTLLGLIFIVYFFISNLVVLATYIEVIHVFLYPDLPSYAIGGAMILLVLYAFVGKGGLRIIVGISFLFFVISQLLLLLVYEPIKLINWHHYFPMFQSTPMDILKGAKATTFTLLGFEILFFIYPFIGNKEKMKLPIYLGISYTTVILLLATMISIGYYSLEDLPHMEWSVLSYYKSIAYSFMERLDYIVIVLWLLTVIPTSNFLTWGMMHGLKRLFQIPKYISLYSIAIITFFLVIIIKTDTFILTATDKLANYAIWLVVVYPFVLLPCVYIKKYFRKQKYKKQRAAKS